MMTSTPSAQDEPAVSPGPFSALSQPVFRGIWIATMASNFGAMIQSVGAAWLMTSIAGAPRMVALVQVSTAAPFMALALLAGAIADNFDRRRIMIIAQTFMLAVSVTLSLCVWTGVISPWLLLTFTFLIGCGAAFNTPSWQASMGDLVPRRDIQSAVALNTMAFNVARSVGPAIGGVVVATANAATAFGINAVSYVGLIVVLLRWRRPARREALPREPLGMAMAAGVRYVAMSPGIRIVMLRTLLFCTAISIITALMPLFARDLIKGGAVSFGLLFGAFGAGAVIGALLSAHLRQYWPTERIIAFASLILVASWVVVALSRSLPLTMASLVFCGACWVLVLNIYTTTMQMVLPLWVKGRALALFQMAAFGGLAMGGSIWGSVAQHYGVANALLVASAYLVIVTLIGRALPLPAFEGLNLDPTQAWNEPETAVPTEARSGPVVIMIEYRIAEEDIPAFLAAMADWRRIRIRDGALRWSLTRDLGNREVWFERYSTPTWLDYIRHNLRRTLADAENGDRVRSFHRGGAPPRVLRLIEQQTGSLPEGAGSGQSELITPLADPISSA